MEKKKNEFGAIIKKHENPNAGFIDFPFDVRKEFSGRSRVIVKALIEGVSRAGSPVKMSGDNQCRQRPHSITERSFQAYNLNVKCAAAGGSENSQPQRQIHFCSSC